MLYNEDYAMEVRRAKAAFLPIRGVRSVHGEPESGSIVVALIDPQAARFVPESLGVYPIRVEYTDGFVLE